MFSLDSETVSAHSVLHKPTKKIRDYVRDDQEKSSYLLSFLLLLGKLLLFLPRWGFCSATPSTSERAAIDAGRLKMSPEEGLTLSWDSLKIIKFK